MLKDTENVEFDNKYFLYLYEIINFVVCLFPTVNYFFSSKFPVDLLTIILLVIF